MRLKLMHDMNLRKSRAERRSLPLLRLAVPDLQPSPR